MKKKNNQMVEPVLERLKREVRFYVPNDLFDVLYCNRLRS
jgi:hypothetical protein